MIKLKYPVLLSLLLLLASVSFVNATHKGAYPVKREHQGIDVKPTAAYAMIEKDSKKAFIVDVRTRFEYQDIGHAVGAYNIPLLFFSMEVDRGGYKKIPNKDFCRDLKARFNTETDFLFMICRSGERSTIAADQAIECGFKKENVFNILGGFEGDKIHEDVSPFYGKRMVGGWRLEGLPWTYDMIPDFMYLPDIKQ